MGFNLLQQNTFHFNSMSSRSLTALLLIAGGAGCALISGAVINFMATKSDEESTVRQKLCDGATLGLGCYTAVVSITIGTAATTIATITSAAK